MFRQRLTAACKLILVCVIATFININKLHVDMYKPLLFGSSVLVVYAFLNPNDPHIKNLFRSTQ
jgi:hypothetical protein